ncbi:MAG: ABC transporter permease [Bacteroidia bacterium]|nr:ABC transporter permease [Bacteroidia bacterium]NNM15746.1 ABC transporter permease [Bacteroidia bacterium]
MFFRLAWRNIWRNKRRTLITIFSIMFAVLLASFTRSMQIGSFNHMIDNVVQFFSGHAQIHQLGYSDDKSLDNTFEVKADLVQQTEQNQNVKAVVARIESFALASNENQTKGVLVIGTEPDKEDKLTQLSKKVVQGSMLHAKSKGVLVAEELAKYLKLRVHDTIVLISQGYHGANAAGKYPVDGIIKYPNPELNKQIVVLNLKQAQHFYDAINRATSLVILANSGDEVDEMMKGIKSKLNLDVYEVEDWKEMMPEIVSHMELDLLSGRVMNGILYMIIGFGIYGTILMMTNERRYEFGVLLSVGMKRLQLSFIVWLEIMYIAIVGLLAGTLVSFPVTLYFKYNPIRFTGDWGRAYEDFGFEPIMAFSVHPSIYLNQVLVIFIIVVFMSFYPVRFLHKLKPVEAMRH